MRRIWRALEAVHAVVYFAPEAATEYAQVGCRGWWMGYFASRSAALGPVGPELVTALFYGFAPGRVARALPDAWRLSSREQVLAARYQLAELALGRVLADAQEEASTAAELTQRMVAQAPLAGRPLFAAHAALRRPADPLIALWHDATALREFRGDGHVAALIGAGLDGCSANVLTVALGWVPEQQRDYRGWSEQEWAAAVEDLLQRGWLAADGAVTPEGRAAREEIEAATDRAAEPALRGLDESERQRLSDVLVGMATRIGAAGAVPYPNAMGVLAP